MILLKVLFKATINIIYTTNIHAMNFPIRISMLLISCHNSLPLRYVA